MVSLLSGVPFIIGVILERIYVFQINDLIIVLTNITVTELKFSNSVHTILKKGQKMAQVKKKFDWYRFTHEHIAVHLKTEKEARRFSEILHQKGFRWNVSGSCLNYPHCWGEKMLFATFSR